MTNDAIFGITVPTNFLISVYSMGTVPILRLLPQYEEVKGVGVGVSRRDKQRDFFLHHGIDHVSLITIDFTIRRATVRGGEGMGTTVPALISHAVND